MEEAVPPPPPPPPPVVEVAPPGAVPVVGAPPAPANPPAATPAAPPPWNTVMKEELLVDSYYMVNFNGFKSGQTSLTPPVGRVFDTFSNSFTMNYAKIGLEVDSDPVTVRADLGYGYLGSVVAGGSPNTAAFLVQQAFAALKIPGTPLTLDMGRFVTGAGSEVIEANKNWLYSRSFLFGQIPFFHTGARLTAKVNDQFSAQLTVANSQNSPADPDVNSGKVVGLQLAFAPLSTTSIIATGYFGKEGPQGMEGDEKITLDLVASHNISDAFGLNLNFDYIKLGEFHLAGAALMARYVAAEHVALAARFEFVNSKANSMADSLNTEEGTVGVAFPFAGHFEARVEVRGDFAGEKIFPGANPTMDNALGEGSKNQFTGTVAFLGFM
jgi:hypothetical protein